MLIGDPCIGIVVDEVVYDCSTWADEHPGGDSVIRNFGGQDCSWQFWRFHNKKDMAKYGVALRIGRTEGVTNRFPEPKRYSRLRGFDAEDW
jgi:cytochrome b involved in lipid metabolism